MNEQAGEERAPVGATRLAYHIISKSRGRRTRRTPVEESSKKLNSAVAVEVLVRGVNTTAPIPHPYTTLVSKPKVGAKGQRAQAWRV
jgi:hypothetical protein